MSGPSTITSAKSRRALLVGALGGLGAWVASAVGRASAVRAANGDPLILGQTNSASAVTRVINSSTDGFRADAGSAAGSIGVVGIAFGADVTLEGVRGSVESGTGVRGLASTGTGVRGNSTSGTGVQGTSVSFVAVRGASSSSYGVLGESVSSLGVAGVTSGSDWPAVGGRATGNATGVIGSSGPGPLPNARAKTGVYGHATQDSGSRGVWGRSDAGQGVRGQATSGVGLFGTASTGYALRTSGRLKADKVSGVATIAAGSTSTTVTPGVNVTSGSFVLLTPKANIGSRGLWFTLNATDDKFTIRMSSSRSSNTPVAWLLLG